MHRLIHLGGISSRIYPRLPFNNFSENVDLNISGKACILCKHLSRSGNLRNQSTVTHPHMKQKKRKKNRSKRVYTDLLVVTDNSLTQHQINVKKLTSLDLKILADSNISLNELYKLKEISKKSLLNGEFTYNNLSDIANLPSAELNRLSFEEKEEKIIDTNVPNIVPSGNPIPNQLDENNLKFTKLDDISDTRFSETENLPLSVIKHDERLEEEEEFESEEFEQENEVSTSPVEKTGTGKHKKHKSLNDKKYREEVMTKTLGAYIDVCCRLKNPERGLHALLYQRGIARHCDNDENFINDINVYNSLLKGFAHRENYSKLSEVLDLANESGTELNAQSYAAIFECLGRCNIKDSYLKQIRIHMKQAVSKGFTFDRIMNEAAFLNNERQIALKAMQSANPSYQPEYDQPIVQYNNHLINHLNCDEQLTSCNLQYQKNKGLFKPQELKKRIEEQIEAEKKGFVTIESVENKAAVTEETLKYRKILDEHYKMWEQTATDAFHRDFSGLVATKGTLNMEPYLRCLPVKDYVTIITEEAKKLAHGSETYSPTVNMLYKDLGRKVYSRYLVTLKEKTGVLDKIKDIHDGYCTHYAAVHPKLNLQPSQNKVNSRQVWQWLEHSLKSKGATLDMDLRPWVPTVETFIGKFLYHIIMHDLKVDVFRTQNRIVKEEVKPHPILSKLYRASVPETLTFPACEVPMRCPPVPWISGQIGAYLVCPSDVIRIPSLAVSQKQKLVDVGKQQIYPNLDALNQLGSIPWKVNQKILNVILEVFNSGGSASLDVPEPPSSLTPPPNPTSNMDKAERFQLFKQKMQYKRKKAEMYSLWCDCLYRLSLANHFRNDVFWLPHNMDFRGRVYPLPPHLNHMGSDLARSMLVFAEAKPLGSRGLDWLKIHLINLTGLKKRDSISDRLKFANDNISLIIDSAVRPLTGKRWWTQSDEPWQTLACCMEIADAMKVSDPRRYRSHFPIHQDGSCNGLQHYAALGRDSVGAFSVNLTPSELPQDVYGAVVALVEEQRAKDAENGIEIAKALDGFVKRKVIKQTVMTTVYGVTRYGAKLQIAKQLKDIDDFPKDLVWQASLYLTSRTFDSIRSMFTSTREIQDWFTECAKLISGVGGQYVEWVTPLGLPVIQPYIKYKKIPKSSKNYELYHMDKYEKPNVLKQKNAFAPNFVHSLDSSHMMLTALNAERAGITFVSVHDCYWTHPSSVEIMNKICREQFVALHMEPILENLSVFFADNYSYNKFDFTDDGSVAELTKRKLNRILRQLPKTGDFDIHQVLNSVYFFS